MKQDAACSRVVGQSNWQSCSQIFQQRNIKEKHGISKTHIPKPVGAKPRQTQIRKMQNTNNPDHQKHQMSKESQLYTQNFAESETKPAERDKQRIRDAESLARGKTHTYEGIQRWW